MFLPEPDWRAPANVQVRVTQRGQGVSLAPFNSFNLALHVADDPAAVEENRRRLREALPEVDGLQWVRQVHGTGVLQADHETVHSVVEADAVYTHQRGLACCVMTADCLPVCFCDRDGMQIAVAHAGWRGLVGGVLEATLAHFAAPAHNILAWLGPAIGPCHFEVGPEVKAAFVDSMGDVAEQAFTHARNEGKWMADLYVLARLRLQAYGLQEISGEQLCTYCNEQHFYSYRREARTGRFATLIYLR